MVVGLLALLVAGEIGARLFAGYNSQFNIFVGGLIEPDPHRRTRLKKNYVQDSIKINSRGFLGPEFEPKKAPGTYRIVTLGDSCSFLPTKDNYPRQLEDLLNARELGCAVEVINVSCPGYSSIQACQWYESEVTDYEHDMLIVFLGWNDIGQFGPEGLGYKLKEVGYLSEPTFAQRLLLNCYLLRSLYVVQGYMERRQPVSLEGLTAEEGALYSNYYPTHYEEHLRRIVRLAQERDREIYLLNFGCLINPDPTEDEKRRMHFPRGMGKKLEKYLALIDAYRSAQARIAETTRTPVIDIASLFDTVEARRVFSDSVHFNSRGAELIATRVADTVQKHVCAPAEVPAKP